MLLVYAIGDESCLQRVVHNLVDNALRYTRPEGERIGVESNPGEGSTFWWTLPKPSTDGIGE